MVKSYSMIPLFVKVPRVPLTWSGFRFEGVERRFL